MNPEAEDFQRSFAQLVPIIVKFWRRLMERQAILRSEQKTLPPRRARHIRSARAA